MKTSTNLGIFVYSFAALLAVGLLLAITAFPDHPAELFPDASPDEVVQGIQWMWEGLSRSRR